MILRKWGDLPGVLKNESVLKYYNILYKKRSVLLIKRLFDIFAGCIIFIILMPLFLILCIAIKMDSKGPVIFSQVRVTQYGRRFRIFKFRTMFADAEKTGTQVTIKNDSRVTKVGRLLRKSRLDEIPQLLNIISGDMSFVGTRPEVVKYVEQYTDEMMATLLLPAGVTSEASIHYKNEDCMLANTDNIDKIYVNVVLPEKMKYNLRSIEDFSLFSELKTMIKTVLAVIKIDKGDNVSDRTWHVPSSKTPIEKENMRL